MQVISTDSEVLKLIFDTNNEQFFIGELIKTANNVGVGVIAQIFGIENFKQDKSSLNAADAKILFTLDESGKWINWKGNVPSTECKVSKVSNNQLLSYIGSSNNPVSLGELSYSPGMTVNTDAAKLEENTVILCDKQEHRINTSYILANELVKNGAKAVILDFRGEYDLIPGATRITAGVDFKLPLNSRGIDILYEKGLADASVESRAVIEDIFMSVQEYANSAESGLIPFSSFKNVVEEEYRESLISELILLKNTLVKYEKQGIYANKKGEARGLGNCLENSNLIILDLSNIPSIWHKDYLDYVITSNIEDFKQRFFLIFEAKEEYLDDNLLNKLYVHGIKSGLKPAVFTGYESKFTKAFLSVAKNLILHPPKPGVENFYGFKNYLTKLGQTEAIIYGKVSGYIPVFMQINQLISDTDDNKIFTSSESNSVIYEQTYHEIEEEPVVDNYPVYEQEVEVISPIVDEQDDFEDLGYSEQDFDDIETYNEHSPQEISSQPPSEEIYEEVETLYTGKKITLDYDDLNLDDEIEEETVAPAADIPIYSTSDNNQEMEEIDLKEGDRVKHQKYGVGVISKVIGYGSKKLCSIQFENVGRRLLDPQLAVLEKI